MTDQLIIIGAGAQARYILNTVSLTGGIEVIGLVDTFNNPAMWNKDVDGARVLGTIDILKDYPPTSDMKVISAIANLDTKIQVIEDLKKRGYAFCKIIHPTAVIARRATLGTGIIINAGVVIETETAIHDHVIIHAGCVVEHDNVLEDFVNLGPGVHTAGRVHIKIGAIVYTGASIIPGITIGERAIVGAGAVVIHDVEASITVVGVPARPIKPGEQVL